MRISAFAVCLALTTGCAVAQTVDIDTQNATITPTMRVLDVHVGGRVQIEPLAAPLPDGAKSFAHEWPGVYFEAAFTGDSVMLKFDDSANEYRLLIDDLPPVQLGQPGRSEVTVGGLTAAPHRVRLEKVTESIGRVGSFDGFYVRADETPVPVKARARQIEFIGDSGQTGYGVRSAVHECTKEAVRLTSDTQNSFPALTAKHFDADYQVNAISGRGIVRNYAGESPGQSLPQVYPFTLPGKMVPYDDPAWQPQIVVISLGWNDFNDAFKATDKWKSDDTLAAAYERGFLDFVLTVHQRHPDAALLFEWMDVSGEPETPFAHGFDGARAAVLKAAREEGIRYVDFFMFDVKEDHTACHWHPSLTDHKKQADWMTRYIEDHPKLWNGK